MTLKVYTARIDYRGDDRFDITRGKASGDGLAFAPSNAILQPALADRKRAEECMEGACRDGAIGALHRATALDIEAKAWAKYAPAYVEEMRVSYRTQRGAWDRLLAQSRVTLVCFCNLAKYPGHCHRVLLAELLVACGAEYMGERPAGM